jgi:aspartyl aminopeptidase
MGKIRHRLFRYLLHCMSLAIDRNDYASNGFPLTERFGATKNEWFDRYLEVDGRITVSGAATTLGISSTPESSASRSYP